MEKYTDTIEARFTGRHRKCIGLCGSLKSKRLLNIGCYNGWFERTAIDAGCAEVIGIDINEDTVRTARAQVTDRRAAFLKSSALDASRFDGDYFDIIAMFDVIEHLPPGMETACLGGIKRILKKDGIVVASVPHDSLFSKLLDPAWYFKHRHYSARSLAAFFKESGFSVVTIEVAGGFYELFGMILLYIFKWSLRTEIPFKGWFDAKRDREYLDKSGFATLFVVARK